MDTATLPSAAEALKAYQGFQAPDSATVLTTAQSKYGIPELAKKVADFRTLTGNLSNAVMAVDPSVTARTAGTLTTEGQRSALVARERAPVVQQLQGANDALGTAKEDFSTSDRNARDEASMTIADNANKRESLLKTFEIANNREETARQTALEQAKFAEGQRQFNEQMAASKASSKGGSTKAASPAEVKLAVAQHVGGQLSGSVGKDGKVSNETWSAALNDAISAGFTVREFWQKYGQYVNPKYKSSYAGYVNR
jgi:hypothetical protein